MDKHFRIEVLNRTGNPQTLIWLAAHQDYSEEFVYDEFRDGIAISESECGDRIIRNLLAGNRGHFGCFEHPQITFNCGWFPHSVMQQLRTHRVGISFDVQSFRYTGHRIYKLGEYCESCFSSFPVLSAAMPGGIDKDIEQIFYLRPTGFYADRSGKHYEYTEKQRIEDLEWCGEAAMLYKKRIDQGYSEEHARGLIPFDVRQHWVVSVNARSLMHLLDLRWKSDAQLEIQQLCDLLFPHFKDWCPQVAEWYEKNRARRARLAP